MDKEKIKEVIISNQEFVEHISLKERNIKISDNFNYIFVGIRRCGKSYLMYQQIQKLLSNGHSIDEILYFNFEDDRLDGMTLSDLDLILQSYNELFKHKPFIFLDEIQNVDGWEKFARRLADTNYRVFITGSNAKMLSKEMATVLGGRYIVQNVFPYSFEEFLSINEIEVNNINLIRKKTEIIRLYEEYFYNGGLPEIRYAQGSEKRMWLSNLYNKIYFGDIISRYKIRNETAVKILIKKLAESVKQPSSFTRLSNVVSSCGTKVKTDTISDYLKYAQESWLIFGVENLASKLAEKETFKKYYFVDNGILNLFLLDPQTSLLENQVAINLLRSGKEFFFYRTQVSEIDFIIPEEKTAIQVSYSIEDEETKTRELKAFDSIPKNLEIEEFLIITKNQEDTIDYNGKKIKILPVWKWILK